MVHSNTSVRCICHVGCQLLLWSAIQLDGGPSPVGLDLNLKGAFGREGRHKWFYLGHLVGSRAQLGSTRPALLAFPLGICERLER